jgi:methionyl-tRNA formyltransferase
LPIAAPESINDPGAVGHLADQNADLLVVCDFGQILSRDALATARVGGINLHGSLLPAYRGAAPVQRAMLSGDHVTGVSVIHMTPRLDGGPILTTRQTEIDDSETAGELEKRLAQLGVEATLEAVAKLEAWDGRSEIGRPQDPARVSKAPRLSKAEGEIDWSQTSRKIDCHVRAMQPWPVAFTHVRADHGKPPLRIGIKEVQPVEIPKSGEAPRPGTITSGEGLCVATGDGAVRIVRLQPAGRREMAAEEFMRGHQLTPGTAFERMP